jgi:hypothetical protein
MCFLELIFAAKHLHQPALSFVKEPYLARNLQVVCDLCGKPAAQGNAFHCNFPECQEYDECYSCHILRKGITVETLVSSNSFVRITL